MLVLTAGTSAAPVHAQAPAAPPDTTAARSAAEFSSLVGRWVRPDGGYVVTIKRVSADGKLDASYANPNPLPFSRAEAMRDGNEIRVFLELTAGGYGGSTYTLTYDPAKESSAASTTRRSHSSATTSISSARSEDVDGVHCGVCLRGLARRPQTL
jgi:uncharacterized protein (DUF2147 family)